MDGKQQENRKSHKAETETYGKIEKDQRHASLCKLARRYKENRPDDRTLQEQALILFIFSEKEIRY